MIATYNDAQNFAVNAMKKKLCLERKKTKKIAFQLDAKRKIAQLRKKTDSY